LRPLTPYASPRDFFGAELRRLRRQAGLNIRQLAELVHYSAGTIAAIEKAQRWPQADITQALDTALSTDSTLSRLLPLVEMQRASSHDTPEHLSAEADSSTFLPPSSTPVVLPTLPSTTGNPERNLTADVPRRVEPELVDCLERLLAGYAQADNVLGPQHLLLTVRPHLAYIDQLLARAAHANRTRLLSVGARYAEFLGWLYQDAGNPQWSEYWSDRALSWAYEADASLLVPYVLMRKSNQASGLRQPPSTMSLALAALRRPAQLPPRVHALALRQLAHGHALTGEETACARALDAAREQVGHTELYREEENGIAGYCTPEYVEMEAASCWMTLGKPREAVLIYERSLATWSPRFLRDRGVHLARLALAHAADGEPEQACATAHEALSIAHDTGSGRAMSELDRLTAQLAVWSDLPAVVEFLEARRDA
jgi:transcriptional regulator with XRE-family HTH domain